ncbi:response regulator [Paraliomyxa miuraensis]|uniref:response regulator n=1 Tax=Paraliomyxa miuraensis TaxID=376150 RepID=UPI00224D17C9|nr:response regulator [Paraliomyxa miuraensis]MCX4240694.1 response regulator [Paraliomyxa miuraensis]
MARTLTAKGCSVSTAKSHAEARALIDDQRLRFDAAVLDHRLPDGDARELVSALANRDPSCSSLVLTAFDEQKLALDYRSRGAFHYATKPINGSLLVALVNATIHNSHHWRRMIEGGSPDDEAPPVVVVDFELASERLRHVAGLSSMETKVAYWILQGLRDAEIATEIKRTERTAKRYVSRVLTKVGVKNRTSLWLVLSQDGDASSVHDDRGDDDDSGDEAPDHDDGAAASSHGGAGRGKTWSSRGRASAEPS